MSRRRLARAVVGRGRLDEKESASLAALDALGRDGSTEVAASGPGVGSIATGLRNRALEWDTRGWVRPHWLGRQTDPRSPAFSPSETLLANVSGRNATAVGTLDGGAGALVDARGLVVPTGPGHRSRGWSLDWWVGSEERWHVPARDAGVRQGLAGDVPVVETRMRVPGGDVIHRAFGVRAGTDGGARDVVVVEIENRSGVPVAVALSVRPYDLEGWTVVREVVLDDDLVRVDGVAAVLLPRTPGAAVAGDLATGDAAATVLVGGAGPLSGTLAAGPDPAGLAHLSVVHALTHTATLRVVLPVDRDHDGDREGDREGDMVLPSVLPEASSVAAGWRSQTDGGTRLVVPDARLQEAHDAARRHLVLAAGDPGWTGAVTGRLVAATVANGSGGDALRIAVAAVAAGGLDPVVSTPGGRPRGRFGARRGGKGSGPGTSEAVRDVGALLWALGRCCVAGLDLTSLRGHLPAVAAAAQWIGDQAGDGVDLAQEAWAVAGLRGAARVFAVLGEAEAAETASHLADRSSPVRHLQAVFPLGLAADDNREWCHRALDAALVDGVDVAATDAAGVDVLALVDLAGAAVASSHPAAADLVDRILDLATPTWTWPSVAHPRHGGGVAGQAHDPAVTAAFVALTASLVVVEQTGGVDLVPVVPRRWYGQGIEAHGVVTRWGTVSAAVRWHGPRPALLWEIEEVAGAPVLGAPGLDPAWSSCQPSGEALLAEPDLPAPDLPALDLATPDLATDVQPEPGTSFD